MMVKSQIVLYRMVTHHVYKLYKIVTEAHESTQRLKKQAIMMIFIYLRWLP